MLSALGHYLDTLARLDANPEKSPELSLRPALDQLFNALTPPGVQWIGEGKKKAAGRPDYTFSGGNFGEPIGYVEAEKPAAKLDHLTGHAKTQNQAFRADFDNFLLTNHLDFRLYTGGKEVEAVLLPPHKSELTAQHAAQFEKLWEHFTLVRLDAPKTPDELALRLARRARSLRAAIAGALTDPSAPLHEDLEAFRSTLLIELAPAEFANLYAETLAYGLFAARCLAPDAPHFSVATADRALRRTPLLRELYRQFEGDIDPNLSWILEEMAAVVSGAAIESIRQYFAVRSGRTDPMIDFYEPFLASYDPRARRARGIYYTPEAVVSFIVSSVGALLRGRFGRAQGLAESVDVLDPATGTGSFLFAVLDAIHAQIGADNWPAYWRDRKPLQRLWGFELLIAPYTVAHLKLALQCEAMGTAIGEGERAQVLLCNTLQDALGQTNDAVRPSLAAEVNAAANVKEREPILVVLGNPPYAGHSANANTWEGEQTRVAKRVESYRLVDGAPLGERNPKWLQDDYVKFLAFAQLRIERSGEGIVAFITPHGYLDNPTFRGLRRSFLETFSELWVLDLHGNANKREVAPDGTPDKNVFDIRQGVSILLAVKQKGATGLAQVHHAELWGERPHKYAALFAQDVETTRWQTLSPSSPSYFFVPRDETHLAEYDEGWKVTEIFSETVLGFQTHRDNFAIAFDRETIEARMNEFREDSKNRTEDAVLQEKYNLRDNRDWQIAKARARVRGDENWQDKIGSFATTARLIVATVTLTKPRWITRAAN